MIQTGNRDIDSIFLKSMTPKIPNVQPLSCTEKVKERFQKCPFVQLPAFYITKQKPTFHWNQMALVIARGKHYPQEIFF